MEEPKKPDKLIVNLDDPIEGNNANSNNISNGHSGLVNKDKLDVNLDDLPTEERLVVRVDTPSQPLPEASLVQCPQCGTMLQSSKLAATMNNNRKIASSQGVKQAQESRPLLNRRNPLLWVMVILIPIVVTGVYLAFTYISKDSLIIVPHDYLSIQEAIEAAENGNEIVVLPGTYNEIINFKGKEIIVRSENPEDPETVAATIIDGGELGSVVTFNSGENSKAILKGFTITGGSGTVYNIEHHEDGETSQMQGIFGGGILIWNGSSPTIASNYIIGNNVEGYGGGIAIWSNSSPLIKDNTITGNISLIGGGIAIGSKSSPDIENNDIVYNQSVYSGGGLAIIDQGANPLIKGNTIIDNISDGEGGGITVTAGAAPSIEKNEFTNNIALRSLGGGGIFIHQSSPIILNNKFTGNTSGGEGGGLSVYSLSSPILNGNTFIANIAFDGGAVWLSGDSSLKIKDPDDNNYSDNIPDDIFRQ